MKEKSFSKKLYHNFCKVSGGSFRRFAGGSPAFLAVWGGQTERETTFLNVKLHATRFRVCVGLLADRRVAAAVSKQPFLQGGVVGADMDKRVFLVKPNVGSLFPLGKPCSHKCSFLRPRLARGAFLRDFSRLWTWGKWGFSNGNRPDEPFFVRAAPIV
jgi:hypothetical protein